MKRRTTKYTGQYYTVEQAMAQYRWHNRRQRTKLLAQKILGFLFLITLVMAAAAGIGSILSGCQQNEGPEDSLFPPDVMTLVDEGTATRGDSLRPGVIYADASMPSPKPETSKPACQVSPPDTGFVQKRCSAGCALCQVMLKSDPTSHPQLNYCQLGDVWCVPECEACP